MPMQQGFDEYYGLPYSNDMWPVGYDGIAIKDTADKKFKYPTLKNYPVNYSTLRIERGFNYNLYL